MALNLAIKRFLEYHVNDACISQQNKYEDKYIAGSSSGIEVFSPNSPALPAFFHPLAMIGMAFTDVKKLYMFTSHWS